MGYIGNKHSTCNKKTCYVANYLKYQQNNTNTLSATKLPATIHDSVYKYKNK